jgi:hypothetical protein
MSDACRFQEKTESAIAANGGAEGLDEQRKAVLAARQLLAEDKESQGDLQNVHSTQSVTQLLKAAKERVGAVAQSVRPPPSPAGAVVANEVRAWCTPLPRHQRLYLILKPKARLR